MIPGTTPTIPLIVNADLTGYNIYATFKAGRVEIIKTSDEITVTVENGKTTIGVPFTQEETLRFKGKPKCEVQIRYEKDNGSNADATTVSSMDIGRILQDGVIGGE